MKLFLVVMLVVVSTACSQLPHVSDIQEKQKLKVLIVDGQNNHTVWPKATVMMKAYLEESGLFDVDVYRSKLVWRGETERQYLERFNSEQHQLVEEPATDSSFSPDFSQYDVVVSNFGYMAADWPRSTQVAFESYMRNGGGFVAVHAANNAFPRWSEFNLMTGIGGWGGRNERSGPYLYYSPEGRLVRDYSKGDGGAHGTKHEFQVTMRNEHPIMEGVPDVWMHAKDECYGDLRGPAKNILVLATALCPEAEKGTGKHEPILMVVHYELGRIFHTTLGHQQESYESVGFITTFLRGTEWAASGRVTQGAVPSDFPTEDESYVRAFTE